MTTPATNVPHSIINSAMGDAGLLQEGDEANSEQLAKHMTRLNDIVNLEQARPGVKLWLLVDQSVTLVAGQGGLGNPYTFKPAGTVNMTKPLKAIQGFYLDSSGANRRPIYPMSWDEWNRLSAVTQQGQISQFFVDKRQLELDVYFWLIPNASAATGVVHLLLQTQVTNSISLTDAMAFPIEWTLYLRWQLASEICTGQPQAIVANCNARAKEYRDILEGWDVEDSPMQFQMDQRMSNFGVSNFS